MARHARREMSPLFVTVALVVFTLAVAGAITAWTTHFSPQLRDAFASTGMIGAWVTQLAQEQRDALTMCSDAHVLIRGAVYVTETQILSVTVDNYGTSDLGLRALFVHRNGNAGSPARTALSRPLASPAPAPPCRT